MNEQLIARQKKQIKQKTLLERLESRVPVIDENTFPKIYDDISDILHALRERDYSAFTREWETVKTTMTSLAAEDMRASLGHTLNNRGERGNLTEEQRRTLPKVEGWLNEAYSAFIIYTSNQTFLKDKPQVFT